LTVQDRAIKHLQDRCDVLDEIALKLTTAVERMMTALDLIEAKILKDFEAED